MLEGEVMGRPKGAATGMMDVCEILHAANAGRPLQESELVRLLGAAGGMSRAYVRLTLERAEDKLRHGIVAAMGHTAIEEACR